jgi:hypothetical protein
VFSAGLNLFIFEVISLAFIYRRCMRSHQSVTIIVLIEYYMVIVGVILFQLSAKASFAIPTHTSISLANRLTQVPQPLLYTECLKRSFTRFKEYINVFRGYVQCFKCHNISKYTEFYLG